MLPTLPPALAVRSTRTWLAPGFLGLTSPGSPASHVPVNLHPHSPCNPCPLWRKSSLEKHDVCQGTTTQRTTPATHLSNGRRFGGSLDVPLKSFGWPALLSKGQL